jgi:hypothetical protein
MCKELRRIRYGQSMPLRSSALRTEAAPMSVKVHSIQQVQKYNQKHNFARADYCMRGGG